MDCRVRSLVSSCEVLSLRISKGEDISLSLSVDSGWANRSVKRGESTLNLSVVPFRKVRWLTSDAVAVTVN